MSFKQSGDKRAKTAETIKKAMSSSAVKTLGLGQYFEMQVPAIALSDRLFFLYLKDVLTFQHFENPYYGVTWIQIKNHYEKFGVMPSIHVINHALAKSKFAYELPAVDIHSIDYIKEQIVKGIRFQQYNDFVQRLIIEQSTNEPPYEELLEEMKGIVFSKPESSSGLDYFDAEPRYNTLQSFWQGRIPTGFASLDIILPGNGLGRKEVFAFMGSPGVGKSLWLINIGAQLILGGKKVLHITREVSEEITSLRYDSHYLGRPTNDLISDVKITIQQIEDLRKNILKVTGMPDAERPLWIKEFPTGGATLNETRAYMHSLKDRHGFVPDVIVDDYLDLAKPDRVYKDDYTALGALYVEFRGWMVQDNLAGVTANQTGRIKDDTKTVTMNNTADSFHKPRVLDVLMTINESEQDRIQNIQRLFSAKNRNGKANMFAAFRVNKELMQISDLHDVRSGQSASAAAFGSGYGPATQEEENDGLPF